MATNQVVVTEEWLGLIGSDPKPDNVRFSTIPNVIPSEYARGSDMLGFFTAVQTKMISPFEEVLDQLELSVKLIICDAFLNWIFDVADRRNILVAAYWAMSASMFTMWYHVDLLEQHRQIFVDISEKQEEWIDYIPVLSPTKVADMSPVSAYSGGWSSVKESVYSGVPMLTFPIFVDQPMNSKVVADDWRNGWRMRKEVHTNNLVKRGEIAETVRPYQLHR